MITEVGLRLLYYGSVVYLFFLAKKIAGGDTVSEGAKAAAKVEEVAMETKTEVAKDEQTAKTEEAVVKKEESNLQSLKTHVEQLKKYIKSESQIFNDIGTYIERKKGENVNPVPLQSIIALCGLENNALRQAYDLLHENEEDSKKIMILSADSARRLWKRIKDASRWERNAVSAKSLSTSTLQHDKLEEHWTTFDRRIMLEIVGDEKRMLDEIRNARNKCHKIQDDNTDLVKHCQAMLSGKNGNEEWEKLRVLTFKKIELIDDVIIILGIAAKTDEEIRLALEKEVAASEKVKEADTKITTE
jgi:hypothetical protein